jgi:hypothetical protein
VALLSTAPVEAGASLLPEAFSRHTDLRQRLLVLDAAAAAAAEMAAPRPPLGPPPEPACLPACPSPPRARGRRPPPLSPPAPAAEAR